MLTEQPILITSIQCKEANGIPQNRFVDFAGLFTAEGTKPLGVSNADTDSGEMLPVVALGIALVNTAEAIAKGAAVMSFDDGYAATHTTGVIVGYALDASSGSGQIIRILLS
jgi:hypothetical protein